MKAFKWFLIGAVALLLAKLASFYMLTPKWQGTLVSNVGGYTYRSTVADAFLILLASLLVLWLVWSLLTAPLRAYRERRAHADRLRLAEGLDAFQQGDWARAEKVMSTTAEAVPEVSGVSRYAATRAALAREDFDSASKHIDAMRPGHPLRAALASAEMSLQRGHFEAALSALDAADVQPLPARGLAMRAQALAGAGRAAESYAMLGALRKAAAFPKSDLDRYETSWASAAVTQAADSNALARLWDEMPKHLRSETSVVSAYAQRAAALGWDEAATRAIEQAVDAQWNDRLVTLYGNLPIGRYPERKARLERWMSSRPESESSWLALASLARTQNDLLAEHDYLQGAVQRSGSSSAYGLLGENALARGETELAARQFAKARGIDAET